MKIYKLRYETGLLKLVEQYAKQVQSKDELVDNMLQQYADVFEQIDQQKAAVMTEVAEIEVAGMPEKTVIRNKADLSQFNADAIAKSFKAKDFQTAFKDAVAKAVKTTNKFQQIGELKPTPNSQARAVTIGFFDGVHRGHQELFNQLVYYASIEKLKPCCYSFDNLPKLQNEARVQTLKQRQEQIAALGVQEYIEQEFNPAFSNLTAEEFVDQILVKQLNTKLLIVGSNFRFGHERAYGIPELADLCKANDIELKVLEPLTYAGEIISTSRIKKLLLAGQVDLANALLGHNFKVRGKVKNGRGLARKFKLPTANMALDKEQIQLPYGVYVTRAIVGDVAYNAITNFGVRPTVDAKESEPTVETSLLDVSMDLYDKEIEIEFLHFQRPEKHFPSFLILTAQIQKDVLDARRYHESIEKFYRYYAKDGLQLYHLPSERFLSGNLSLLLALPLNARNASCMTLLGNILSSCNANFQTHQSFMKRLAELYGLQISANTCALGDMAILQFDLQAIFQAPDGTYTFREGTDLLFDCLLNPLRDKEHVQLLDRQTFNCEKQNLLADLAAQIDDRDNYALKMAIEELYAGTDYRFDPHGERDFVEKLTLEELSDFWLELLKTAEVMVFTAGNIGQKTLHGLKKHLDNFPKNKDRFYCLANVNPTPYRLHNNIKHVENCNFVRSRYLLFFSNLPPYTSNKVLSFQLLLSVLVGDVQSLLFRRLREELGLVYGINYDLLSYMDCFALILALNEENVPLALKETAKILDELKAGKLADDVFNNTKLLLQNELINATDSLFGLMTFQMNQLLRNAEIDQRLLLDQLVHTSKAEVISLAQNIEYRGSYHLIEGKQGHAE